MRFGENEISERIARVLQRCARGKGAGVENNASLTRPRKRFRTLSKTESKFWAVPALKKTFKKNRHFEVYTDAFRCKEAL